MEQFTKDEARILLELVNRPRSYQGTIEDIRKIADTFDGIRQKLIAMGGAEPPQGTTAQVAREGSAVPVRQPAARSKRKRR